jgi:hypothetical protein
VRVGSSGCARPARSLRRAARPRAAGLRHDRAALADRLAGRAGTGREALATHPETAFVAATTGSSNLVAAVICRGADAPYGYLTRRVAALDGIVQVTTAPVIRQVKQLATTP